MIRYKSLRPRGTAVSAAVIFLFSGACLVSEIAAQSAEPAVTGFSLSSPAPAPFLVAPSIPLGYAPSGVATGDLRRSGKLDLVTADYNSGKVTVFLGAGQGKFASGAEYDAGPHPSAVLVADINGDGRPDVLVTNESEGTISVLFGNGDGTLRARQSYTVGFNPSFIATGDFTGSGKVDLAVAGKSGNLLAILLNDGDGNLQKPVLRSLSKTPTALTVADLNDDGHADLALANADGTVSVLLGKGAGLFRLLPDIPVGSGSLSSINSGDLNKDGKIDLVVTQLGQKLVSVLIGRGDGTFASPVSYPVGSEPVSTLVADVNGDGVPALVVINKSSNTFSILGGNGDGTFKTSVDFVAGNAPLAAVAGDFYGNGHADLAIINHSSQTVSVPLGNGDGTFKAARSYSAGVQPAAIASGNLDGGKIPALVVANYCGSDFACNGAGSVAVFLSDDKGAYRLSSTYTVGAGPVSVELADVNGDRNLDIVVLNRLDKTASVLLGAGDGTFRQPMTFPLAGAPIALAVSDLNKDGKPDLAVLEDCGSSKCSQAGSVEILLGGGDGSFQSAASYPVSYSPVSVAVGAINGDKNLDLVVANRCGKDATCQSAGTATVLIGDGTGKFTPGTEIALGNSPSSIALGNLTGSGLDLVVSRSTDNAVAVLHSNGDGTFRAAVPYPVGNNPGALVVADFNGDGKADVAVANVNDSTVSILFGRGDGTLQTASALAVGSGPTSLTAIGRINTRHASLATANGNSESSSPGTEFTVLPNLQSDPPLATFVMTSGTNPSIVNEGVLLTATLTGVTPNPAPSGTVTFDSGATALSDCTGVSIAQGVSPSLISTATCTTHTLTVGSPSDSLTAVYSGDAVYDTGVGETSPAVSQTVAAFAATINVTATATPVNQPVTLTAQLAGTGIVFTPIAPSGTFNFMAGGTTIATCGAVSVNATGGASCTTSSLAATAATTYAISVTYSGDTNFTAAAAGTATQTYIPFASTINVTATATPVNQPVTLTAQLAGTGIAFTPTAPSGTFNFTAGGTTIATCGAVSVNATGGASCTTSSLAATAATTYAISVTYSGDTNFTAAAPGTATQTYVSFASTINVTATATPVNQPVTLTAQLAGTGIAFTPTAPSGTFNFTAGGTTIATCGAVSVNATGGASCITSSLTATAAKTYAISVTYSGDSNFTAAAPGTATQTYIAFAATINVTGPGTTPVVNTAVTLTAQLAGTGIVFTPTAPSGKFNFTAGGTTIATCGAVSVNATGGANCITSTLVAPSDAISVTYSGDTNFTTAAAGTMTQNVSPVAATLTVTGSPTSVPVDALPAAVFTAQVGPPTSITPVTPSGTVTFLINGSPSADCPAVTLTSASAGAATCTTSGLLAPADVISATYAGDKNFTFTGTATGAETVTKIAATTTLTSSPVSPAVNQAVTLTATVKPPTGSATAVEPSGSVTFTQGATSLCSAAVISSTTQAATCNYAFNSAIASPGSNIIATYSGDQNFTAGAGSTIQEVVTAAGTTTAVVSSPNPSAVNQLVSFTATVTPAFTAGTTKPTGSVVFKSTTPAITLCTETLSGGTVPVCTYTFTSPGTYDVVATYSSGDANFTGSASGATADAQVVNTGNTSVSLTSSLNPSFVNELVTFNATINFPSGTSVPTGTVTYLDGATALPGCVFTGTTGAPFTGGVVPACTVPLLTQGTHSITAKYTGDSNFNAATSNTVPQVVNSTATTTSVVSSPNPSAVNAQVTFTATVTPAFSGTTKPTGTVTFTDTSTAPATTLCLALPITAGVVPVCNFKFTSSGSNDVVATYTSGDTNFSGSASGATADVQSVGVAATTVALTSSQPTSSTVNQTVTFTATITSTSGTSTPTGTVAFTFSGPQTGILCSAASVGTLGPVTSATCSAPLPASGTYTITATYSGDVNFAGSSKTLPQVVNKTGTKTGVVASPSTISVNQSVTFTATVTPTIAGATTPNGSVAFSYTPSGGSAVNIAACSAQPVSTVAATTTAQCTGQALPAAGSYTLTAVYSGDSNFLTSTGTAAQSVGKTSTTTSVVSSPSTSSVNQPVAFTATVTPAFTAGTTVPTGTVSFVATGPAPSVAQTSMCTVTIANGVVPVCNYTFTTSGTYTVVATYNVLTDPNFTTSSSPSSGAGADVQTVTTGTNSVVLSASPTSSVVNQLVTFNATISVTTSGTAQPTGSVVYSDGGTAIPGCTFGTAVAPMTFTGGIVPACSVALSSAATHPITATFTSSNSNFSSAGSNTVQYSVSRATPVTSVVSSPNPSAVNAKVIATATVTPPFTTGTAVPSGNVVFTTTPATTTCTATIVAGTPTTCPFTFSSKNNYDIVATYQGDSNFVSSASGATADVQTVGVQATTVTLTSSLNPSFVNEPVTFNATINLTAGTSTTPTGTVIFKDGATVLCTIVSSSSAPFTGGVVPSGCMDTLLTATSTSVTHAITAAYSGDSNFGASTGNLTQTVNPEATATTVVAAPVSPVALNTPVTFTATVTPSPNVVSANSPTGTVTFSYGGTNLCTSVGVTPATGSATAACSVTLPAAGTYLVIATYSADANFSKSASSALSFVVGQTPTTLSLSSSLPTAVVSQIVTFAARVVSGNPGAVAPNGTVTFSSNDPGNIASECGAQPVNPVASLTVPTGFDGIAHCSVQFPITEQFTAPFMVLATYTPTPPPAVQDFTTSSSSIQQAVQNYSVVFTAPVSGTPPAITPVFVTQGYSNINDLFNPNTDITVQVTSSGSFKDKLNITCTVTAQLVSTIPAGQAVSDPSCAATTSASTLSGVTGSTLSFKVQASAAAPVGSYNVTITATDNSGNPVANGGAAYSLSETTATPVVVFVEGEGNGLTLAQGATGTENPVFNTAAAASGSKLLSFACGKVFTAAGVSVPNPSSAPVVTCTGPTGGATVGSDGLTAVQIQVSLATTAAQLTRSSTVSLAALLGIPLLALMGWFGSNKSPRRNFFRFIGLMLLMAGVTYAVTGCGGSFTQTGGLPGSGGLKPGSYLVQVIAYDGSNQTGNQYFAVVPLTVNANSAQ